MDGIAVPAGVWVVVSLVALALLFDFLNGFHDAANAVATVVATGVLRPAQAVVFAAFFNFVALLVFPLTVAATVGKGIVLPQAIDTTVVAAALLAAIAWSLWTWYRGTPSSSSHALFGGLLGAVWIHGGMRDMLWSGIGLVLLFLLLSPLLGFVLGRLLMRLVVRLFHNKGPVPSARTFRRLQLLSSAAYSLGHGGNDAQKTIGLVWLLLLGTGYADVSVNTPPTWVILSCYAALALGTLLGGWRIVRTMGIGLTRLTSATGFCAETAGALTLLPATVAGIPVSTTQAMVGAIVGTGTLFGRTAVRWRQVLRIAGVWCLTVPACGALAAAVYWLLHMLTA